MDVIYAWAEPSSHGTTTYEILLYADGSLSWVPPRLTVVSREWLEKKRVPRASFVT